MNKSSNIRQELESISPFLAESDLELPYEVPSAYFENFPALMLSLLKTTEIVYEVDPADEFSPILHVDKSNPFTVPADYFENLAGDILSKIKGAEETPAQELRNISPLLAGIPKSNPYFLEDNYFQNLTLPVEKDKKPAKARVYVMETWKRFAAAAVFAGIILTSIVFYFNKTMSDQTQVVNNGTNLKPLTEKALSDFLAIDDLELLPVPLNEDENVSFALIDINENTINEVLQTIGDNAIKEFVNENPGAVISDELN